MTAKEFINTFKESKGRLPSAVELSKQLNLTAASATQLLIKYVRSEEEEAAPKVVESPVTGSHFSIIGTLRGILWTISGMSFLLSVYFTGLWFMGKFPLLISGLISLTMVTFMVTGPQASRYVDSLLVKTVLWLCFTIAMAFSMGSTLAGQYNKSSAKLVGEVNIINAQKQFGSLEQQEAELLQLIKDARVDKEIHSETLISLSASAEDRLKNWQQISTERKQIDKYNNRIEELTSELKQVRGKEEVALEEGVQEVRADFFTFLAGITGRSIDFIEFMVSALPAVFIDLIAALSLNLALFLKEK